MEINFDQELQYKQKLYLEVFLGIAIGETQIWIEPLTVFWGGKKEQNL